MKKLMLILTLTTMSLSAQQKEIQPTVSVSGEGIVKIEPDEAVIRVRVEHTGKSASEVKQLNDKSVDAVLKFLKGVKIDKKDVMSERINLNKNYDYQKKQYNYVANQTLKIRLRDLSRYDVLMQGLLDSGINRIDGIQFHSSRLEALKSEARIKAMKNAKMKAGEYAGALDQGIGKAIMISENTYTVQPPMPVYKTMAMESRAMADESMETLAVGEMEVKTRVQVVFELK